MTKLNKNFILLNGDFNSSIIKIEEIELMYTEHKKKNKLNIQAMSFSMLSQRKINIYELKNIQEIANDYKEANSCTINGIDIAKHNVIFLIYTYLLITKE